MRFSRFVIHRALGTSLACFAVCGITTPATAGVGDLLVAPTRIVLDGHRGTEIVLNNIGTDTANYRVSLELRRMTPEGKLVEVPEDQMTPAEKTALALVSYAPRRVTLSPNQPQSIRVGIRPPEGLVDGEYRVHMLFRAIPDAKPLTQKPVPTGLTISLTPIYGVLIPVIVRHGALQVRVTLSDAHLEHKGGASTLDLSLARSGSRSVYGDFIVYRAGSKTPLYTGGGIACYTEIDHRHVSLPLTAPQAIALTGPVRIEYRESDEAGGGLIASTDTVLN